MKVAILKPRLDVSFKPGHVPEERGPIIPIRTHWENFVNKLLKAHLDKGDDAIIIERPLWQFDDKLVLTIASQHDLIYMPHKQKFEYPNIPNALFYMQSNFPDYFTVDSNGWGAFLSYLPFTEATFNPELWHWLKSRIKNNVSKFDQPKKKWKKKDYWLFVCQIPHDQVILQSSKVGVLEALEKTIALAKDRGKELIVKGHPVNPGSMFDMIDLCRRENIEYVDDISIHDALKNSEAVFMVNSGVGFEAMVHEKPIVIFGNSEYESVVNKYNGKQTLINNNIEGYKLFLSAYFEHLFYTGDSNG